MEGFEFTWWMWCSLGMLLMLAEFITPGAFYQFFFGLGAVAVGLLGATGMELPVTLQLLLFVVLSAASIAVLRKPLRARFNEGPDEDVDQVVGTTAVAVEEIAPNALGKAELRGAQWNARNVSDAPIVQSERCRVVRVDGLTLEIQGEKNQKIGG